MVVVATGARGGILRADKENCGVPIFDIFSAMDRPSSEWSGEVAVLGGDNASCHTAAANIAREGVKVHIITSAATLAEDKAPITALFLSNYLAENARIVVHAADHGGGDCQQAPEDSEQRGWSASCPSMRPSSVAAYHELGSPKLYNGQAEGQCCLRLATRIRRATCSRPATTPRTCQEKIRLATGAPSMN